MKLNKLFLGLLGVAALTLGACSDDDDYTRAEAPTNAQVYFPTSIASTYKLVMAETPQTFNVPVARVSDGALTVNVTSKSALSPSAFTLPSSVSFNAGEKETVIPITYDPQALGYDNRDTLTITIGANDATPYGIAEYEFVAYIPSPWKSLGKATITDDLITSMFGVDNVSWKVEIQENELQPGYYRLVNAYNTLAYPYNEEGDFDPSDHFFYIHAEDPDAVWFDRTYLGVNWGYGDFNAWSVAGYNIAGGSTVETEKAAGHCGTLKEGVISFPANGILFNMPGYAGHEGDLYYANESGLFTIVFPGYSLKDMSADVAYAGIYTDAAGAVFVVADVTLGADAPSAKAIVVPGDADPSAVADAIAAGEVETMEVGSGRAYLPMPEDLTGKIQIVVVTLDGTTVKAVASSSFEYYGGGASPWTSLGEGYWVDDIVVPLFTEAGEPYAYPVEIQESTETPGLYRVVNAYAPVAAAFGASGGNENIEIHAEDPAGVYIMDQPIGLDFSYGAMSIETDAGYLVSQYGFDAVKEQMPDVFGTLADGVFSFPVLQQESSNGTLVNYQIWLNMGDNSYFGGRNGAFQVFLPGAADTAARAKVRSIAKATDFAIRLNGGKLSMTANKFNRVKTAKKVGLLKSAKKVFR